MQEGGPLLCHYNPHAQFQALGMEGGRGHCQASLTHHQDTLRFNSTLARSAWRKRPHRLRVQSHNVPPPQPTSTTIRCQSRVQVVTLPLTNLL